MRHHRRRQRRQHQRRARCTRPASASRRTNCASARAPSSCARPRSAPGLLARGRRPPPTESSAKPRPRAIEALLEQALNVPEPSEEACRRHYAAHEATYRTGERVRARHILFAVTPGVDVVALRKRAEAALLDVRCHDGSGRPFRRGRPRHCPTVPAAPTAAIWAGSLRRGLRTGVRARDLRARRDRRAAAARAQPLRPARGRGAGARARRRPAVRVGARCGCHGVAPAGLRHRIAPVPSPAGRRRNDRTAWISTPPTRRWCSDDFGCFEARRCLNFAFPASTTCCAPRGSSRNRSGLLFVFAGAELPDDATPEQRQRFAEGAGGALVPLMCVDKVAGRGRDVRGAGRGVARVGARLGDRVRRRTRRARRPLPDLGGGRGAAATHGRGHQGWHVRLVHPVRSYWPARRVRLTCVDRSGHPTAATAQRRRRQTPNMQNIKAPDIGPVAASRGFALWNLGFRPFYLAASAFAALSILLWICQYTGHLPAAYLATPSLARPRDALSVTRWRSSPASC